VSLALIAAAAALALYRQAFGRRAPPGEGGAGCAAA
jgi:hypothetical protein